ncbi:MAG: hypothetical protein ABIA37_02670 [Candidatus Woesearchaeota archaeon]
MEVVPLAAAIGTAAIAGGVLTYIKLMKKKVKKFVLRNEKIDKYYK